MTTDRTQRLSPQQLALKLATREAVKAAGGQEFVAGEVARTQSRISDYVSPNTADFMPIDLVAKVEALGAGAPGHPHVTRALARAQQAGFVSAASSCTPDAAGCELALWLARVAGESSDVIQVLASGAVMPGQAMRLLADLPAERKVRLRGELDQLIDVLAGLNAAIDTS